MTKMFGHHIRSELLVLYLAEGIAVFLAVFALMAWAQNGAVMQDLLRLGLTAAALAVCSGLVLGASGLYLPATMLRIRRLAASTAVAAGLMVIIAVLSLLLIAPRSTPISPINLAGLLVLAAALGIAAARCIHAAALARGLLRRRLLIIGEAAAAAPDVAGTPGGSVLRLRPNNLAMAMRPGWLRARGIWAVVLPTPLSQERALREICRAQGVEVMNEDQFHECRLKRVACDRLPMDWLNTARAGQQNALEAMLRRGFDIAVALALLLLALPLMLLAALMLRLDSPGPVFYRQERCGLHGRVFSLLKFRSMAVNAEAAGVPVWATKADPRVTRFGRVMRLTRIDELPQLLNVLSGDMSVVGPRPERPGFVAQLGEAIPHYNDRASVKPGITGWAQVNYPYGASVEDARMKLAYDLYYVRHRSLFLDLLILVATVRVVLFQEGAR